MDGKTFKFDQGVTITFEEGLIRLAEFVGFYTKQAKAENIPDYNYVVYYHRATYSLIITVWVGVEKNEEFFVERVYLPFDKRQRKFFRKEIAKYFQINWRKVCEFLELYSEKAGDNLSKSLEGIEAMQTKNKEKFVKELRTWIENSII